MIDLKSVVEKYPECLDSATKFKSYMMDLYPDNSNKARIRILADIVDCGIALEIKNGKTDSISVSNFCNTMESQYGYSVKLVEECVNQFLVAFGFVLNDNSGVNREEKLGVISDSIENEDETKYVCNLHDFIIEDSVLKKYTGHDEFVAIPNGVTSIDYYAFSGCKSLTSIVLPESVMIIEAEAFELCENLTTIKLLSASIDCIELDAFYGCQKIETVYFYNEEQKNEFADCFESNVKLVIQQKDKTKISNPQINVDYICDIRNFIISISGEQLMKYNGSERYVAIPDSVIHISDYAFSECDGLIRVKIPNNVTNIGDAIFENCYNLKSVVLPNRITAIGFAMFYGCSKLDDVILPNSIISIDEAAFSGCGNLTSITLPNSVTNIGDRAFEFCRKLTNMTIPNGVTHIGKEAFYRCENLASITLPNGVASIGDSAFEFCGKLTSLTLPNAIGSIGKYAFSGCSSLKTVYFNSEEQKNKFAGCFEPNVKLVVLCDDKTEVNEHHANVENQIITTYEKDGITYICNPDDFEIKDDELINYTGNDKFVYIPDTVRRIGKCAFAGSLINSIVIPDRVLSIGDEAFKSCENLTSITIPEEVVSIGEKAFQWCKNLKNIIIGEKITRIGWLAFHMTAYYDNADNWENNLLYLGKYLITYNKNFAKSFKIKPDTQFMAEGCFYGCYDLKNIVIPKSIARISDKAFWQCKNLTNVTISDGVLEIGDEAFYGCEKLRNISIPSSVNSIGNGAFECCTSLTSVMISNGVTRIESYAFLSCDNIKTIHIPDSISHIGEEAFCFGSEFSKQHEVHFQSDKQKNKFKDCFLSYKTLFVVKGENA